MPTCLVFAADHRNIESWTLPFIRITDNNSSALNIMQDKQLMKYKDVLSEVSRMMYVYRNIHTFGKLTYIGFCHYRQFFAQTMSNQPLLKTSNNAYLYTVMTPNDHVLKIQQEQADGLLGFEFPEIIFTEQDLVSWFKALNKTLDYLKIPDGLVDFTLQSIYHNIPSKLLPFFIASQKNLNIYHSNIFTLHISVFNEMMQIFENIFNEVITHYESNYANIADQFSSRWFGYLFEYLYSNTYFHALELSKERKFAYANMLKIV